MSLKLHEERFRDKTNYYSKCFEIVLTAYQIATSYENTAAKIGNFEPKEESTVTVPALLQFTFSATAAGEAILEDVISRPLSGYFFNRTRADRSDDECTHEIDGRKRERILSIVCSTKYGARRRIEEHP